ncbi:DUF2958 domain-containing protein [Sphingobium sp. B2]|uniref:DUF2958 domain-containing protein n=1 Tax=Sphingobium sp. B2 TaxID=2583228 RepID=UPI0011A93022|nr:DUF2958 domain-containing protein [Sphingobium sp. B2]
MILLTPGLRAQLLANGAAPNADHVPVVKFFNPIGQAVWLASMMEDNGEILFGIADLGFGTPEVGSFSLTELAELRLSFDMGIERDVLFETQTPLSIWSRTARRLGCLREAERTIWQSEQEG